MFYPFRALLGLRMGTLLNAAAMLVIYRQVTVFLAWFQESFGNKAWKLLCRPSLVAFFVVCRFDLILQSGTYMVELLALPFSGNAVSSGEGEGGRERPERSFCLQPDRRNSFLHEDDKYCISGAAGVLYIWKIRKDITVPLFLSCLAAGTVQVTVYLVYNTVSTGKPGFPYYNTIFQSEYYPIENFKDRRWGPAGPGEVLCWPWYMIRYPDYRLSELPCAYNLDLAAGYLGMAGILAAGLYGRIRKTGRKRPGSTGGNFC